LEKIVSFSFQKIFFLFFLFFLLSSQVWSSEIKRTQILMGDIPVTIQIKTRESLKTKAMDAMSKAFQKAQNLENILSEFKPNSEVSFFNHLPPSKSMALSSPFFEVMNLALQVSIQSDGAFDVTYPSGPPISYRDLILDKVHHSILKLKPLKIGLGGIAKGYIVDYMSATLRKKGFKNFLIAAGGDLYAQGRWTVQIINPKTNQPSDLTLLLKNQAASTSGLYERGNHIVDARTHQKTKKLLSTTIIAKNASLADAWDTTSFILGEEETRKRLPKKIILILIDLQGKTKFIF